MSSKALATIQKLWIPLALLCLFGVAVLFRPLLPVDETRYMSVAWEMHLRGNWLSPLTVNFQPYHHKPPLLFWLINLSWSVFGVSRWAGLIPVVVMAGINVVLTKILSRQLFPTKENVPVSFLMTGSLPFLIYSTLVMFDITLTVFVLSSLIILIFYSRSQKLWLIIPLGFLLGMGVLTKGPVAWLYVIFPMLMGPYWIERKQNNRKWYGSCLAALLLSVVPVLFWLLPVLKASSNDFAFWLVWEQTAGRVTGDFNDAHIRPFYFYLPLLPALFMPWILLPSFWQELKKMPQRTEEMGYKFLISWVLPVILAFSLISGKQPHYLLPLLPAIIILSGTLIKSSLQKIVMISGLMILLAIFGQIIASETFLKNYDLQPIANFVRNHPEHDWAFVRKYHGEVTYLGRLEHSIESEQMNTIQVWFSAHPNGLAIIRYSSEDEVKNYKKLFNMNYRGKQLGVFRR